MSFCGRSDGRWPARPRTRRRSNIPKNRWVLDASERLGLADSAPVLLVGDQGYPLGHLGQFQKRILSEPPVRVTPLMRSIPCLGQEMEVPSAVELLDGARTSGCKKSVKPGLRRPGLTSLKRLAGQNIKRNESWILRGSRAPLKAPKFVLTWLPAGSKRAVVSILEN